MPTLWGQKIIKIITKSLSSLIPPFLVEDRMTFWKWTFLKYDKCPNLISSKKSFFAALKNIEEITHYIAALRMLRKTKPVNNSLKNILGFWDIFWDIFWTFLIKLPNSKCPTG
jgi:hypothetical protein